MTLNTPPDMKARQTALDATHSFIVQAPAGSGKTALLTQRFLVLLATVRTPEEIIALTFTRKAAHEMRMRIVETLRDAQTREPTQNPYEIQTRELAIKALKQAQEQEWNILDNPNRLQILTIDALCARLCDQMPVLSQFGGKPTIDDDPEPLYEEAAQRLLDNLDQSTRWQGALHRLIRHLNNQLGVCERLIKNMLAKRDQWLPHIFEGDPSTRRKHLEQSLKRISRHAIQNVIDHLPIEHHEPLLQLLRFTAEHLPANAPLASLTTLPNVDAFDSWQLITTCLLNKTGGFRKRIDKRQGFPTTHKDAKNAALALLADLANVPGLTQALQTLSICPPPTYSEQQWQILSDLLEILPIAVAQLKVIFTKTGKVDFCEIAMAARTALGHVQAPSELALRLDHQIQHLLIDEFQDTSYPQFELLHQLTAGWQPDDGRTVFLVGDPMQSIYRFRDARVGLFLQVWEHGLTNVRVTPLALTANFRSQAGIIEWINDAFETIFPSDNDPNLGGVRFHNANAMNPPLDIAPIIHFPCQTSVDEASQVAKHIQHIQSTDPDTSIAILVRSRRHLEWILPQLQQHQLPFQAIDLDPLVSEMVINDLWSLTRALLHPADSLALLSVLRAPWCGLTLADLLAITESPGLTLLSKASHAVTEHTLSQDGHTRLKRCYDIVFHQIQQRARGTLRHWVEQTWYALAGPACLKNEKQLKDAQTFFECLDQFALGGDLLDFERFEAQLSRLFSAPNSTTGQTIQVMTMHKSKGLEFDYVFLPGLGKTGAMDPPALLSWDEMMFEEGRSELVLAPIKAAHEDVDKIAFYLAKHHQQQTQFETQRLLYVAMTRAKKQCILLFEQPDPSDDNPARPIPKPHSLLATLWPHLPPGDVIGESHLTEIEPSSQMLTRLPLEFEHPLPHPLPALGHNKPEDVNSLWHPLHARAIGTVMHKILETFEMSNHASIEIWRVWCLEAGVTSSELDGTIDILKSTWMQLFDDPKARWIFDPHHEEVRSEWSLTSVIDGQITNVILDRTFVCQQGIRWIVDFKTPLVTSATDLDFYNEQEAQYRPQLNRYAEALAQIETRPIHLALYFPMQQVWREWTYEAEIAASEEKPTCQTI